MSTTVRHVEIFVSGSPLCNEAIVTVTHLASKDDEVVVSDIRNGKEVLSRARGYGINAIPAVVVDGRLMDCCARGPVDEQILRAAGVGQLLG